MQDIEPYFKWRDDYIASEDVNSPFYNRKYSETHFTKRIYNFYIHPQWDSFGSETLYIKILFVDYENGFALMELIGEWNDCLYNDIMYLKRKVIEFLLKKHISKFIFFCENVLNFHASDDAYYEEWYQELKDNDYHGYVLLLNVRLHVEEELLSPKLQNYMIFGEDYCEIEWRGKKPNHVFALCEELIHRQVKRLSY